MNNQSPPTVFHPGEIAVQQRAGVREQARRLVGMLGSPDLDGGPSKFLSTRDFAALAGRDENALLWVSPLSGQPGFLAAGNTTLRIAAPPVPGDPLHRIPSGQPIGLIAMDFAARRRMRINGTLTSVTADGLSIDVDQAYGNCPKYIHQRDLTPDSPDSSAGRFRYETELSADDAALIAASDTFFLGTTHGEQTRDASHRGGPAGFVRVSDANTVWWPDYPGNNMFNSLGNLATDDTAALLFIDFTTGSTLQLSGVAEVVWGTAGAPGDDGGVGRRVRFTVQHTARGHAQAYAGRSEE